MVNKLEKENELVSCVIPSYKRCETVIRAVDSVLAQTYKNIEVCIVDDNTPGDEYSLHLQEVLKKYKRDNRVRYISQNKHINGAAARNAGIRAANGKYIGFLDDDDEWLPDKIYKQIKVLQENTSLDAVSVLWKLYMGDKEVRRCNLYKSENLQFKIFLREVAVFTSTVLIKKSAIEKFGGFDESLIRHQDLQFLIDALNESTFSVIPEFLVILHGDSAINRPDIDRLIQAKKDFFRSVNQAFIKYDKSEQERIKNAHYYEVAFQSVKAKKYSVAVKYLLKAGFKPQSIMDLFNRIKDR